MDTPKNLRYLPYINSGQYPLEAKGYEMVLQPDPQKPRQWRTWHEVNEWCETKRKEGYYARAFAEKSQVYDSPNFVAFIKKKSPQRRVDAGSGEVTYLYRGFEIVENEPDPRLPAYYVSKPGVLHQGFGTVAAAAEAIDAKLDNPTA